MPQKHDKHCLSCHYKKRLDVKGHILHLPAFEKGKAHARGQRAQRLVQGCECFC